MTIEEADEILREIYEYNKLQLREIAEQERAKQYSKLGMSWYYWSERKRRKEILNYIYERNKWW